MKKQITLLLSGVLLSGCLLATPAHADPYLNGVWSGAYDYGDQIGPNAVWFSVVFETEGDEVKGRSLEMQTFGREPSVGLSAELKGVASGDIISLVKKYDGSGGQSHSVHLRLSYDADGNLTGEWMLDPQTKGRVELFKLGFTEAELDAFAEDDYD